MLATDTNVTSVWLTEGSSLRTISVTTVMYGVSVAQWLQSENSRLWPISCNLWLHCMKCIFTGELCSCWQGVENEYEKRWAFSSFPIQQQLLSVCLAKHYNMIKEIKKAFIPQGSLKGILFWWESGSGYQRFQMPSVFCKLLCDR